MKTLAVLAALAAVATAVPALPRYGYEGYRPVYRLPAQYRREKKSPQELSFVAAPALEVPSFELSRPELEVTPDVSARTIGLKKPIIVKKKFGYHLYRDSAEEQAQADPQEKCTKEVKVKLCDAATLARSSEMRSADEDSSATLTENEMQHRIKMAKDAVENLQKMTHFKNAQKGPDAEMHEDIEVARQALEHIQKNFGNLEAMNVQATTLSDAEALQNARFKIANTEGERMAQWKEAIDNIQKNAEIAKNIEDSFKSASPEKISTDGTKLTNKSSTTIEDNHEKGVKGKSIEVLKAESEAPLKKNAELVESIPKFNEHIESSMKNAENDAPVKKLAEKDELLKKNVENGELLKKSAEHEEMLKISEEHKLTNLKNAEETAPIKKAVEEDSLNKHAEEIKTTNTELFEKKAGHEKLHEMETSASEQKETMLTLNGMPVKAKEAEDIKVEHRDQEKHTGIEHDNKAKSTEFDSSLNAPAVQVVDKPSDNEKFAKAALSEDKIQKLENAAIPKQSEDTLDMAPAQSVLISEMKSVPLPPVSDSHRSANAWANNDEKKTMEEKTAWKETHDMKILAKSSNSVPVTNDKKIEHETTSDFTVDTTSLMKNAEPSLNHGINQKDIAEMTIHGKGAQEMKSAENKEFINQHELQRPIASNLVAPLSRMNAALESNSMPKNRNEDFEFRAQGQNWHADKMSPKTDEMFRSDADFERNAHTLGQQHHIPPHSEFGMGSHLHNKFHHEPHMPHQHQHGMHGMHGMNGVNGMHNMHGFHGKASEADSMVQATSQLNSNDAGGKAAAELWKQKEAARGAYGGYGAGAGAVALSLGGGAAGGPGAVGVFPGANVGGCAIPLLLSCSPSVVPGSLAKSSYGAHAYRAGEDIHDTRFHHKRDTKKNNEIPTTKVKRTPAKLTKKVSQDKKL